MCYSHHFGVQNGSLQAEILQHVLDFELKQFTESITMITMGARNTYSKELYDRDGVASIQKWLILTHFGACILSQ